MTQVIILDRDGTINVDRPDYVKELSELVIIPGAGEAIARLCRVGYSVLVCTNQSCVGKGLITSERLAEINNELERRLAAVGARIARFYVCPHVDSDLCTCRKPLPGLAETARRDWGFDPAITWAIGDATRDARMARGAGCKPALVLTGKGETSRLEIPEVPAFKDLGAFVDMVVAQPGIG